MPQDESLLRLIDAAALARQNLLDRITALVVVEFERFDGWYDPRLVGEVAAQVAAKVSAGQMGVAQLTDAYLARSTSYVVARTVTGAGVPQVFGQSLRIGPANHEEVYTRVAAEYRRQRSRGRTDSEALTLAMNRAVEMVGIDLGLAHQHQVQRFTVVRNVTRYRRIIRSEKTCGLCAAASHRVYLRGDLMPIHARCRCGVIAIQEGADPGAQINDATLGEIYGAADSTAAKALKRVRVEVVQHGELGPQLRVAGQNFRGPGQVAA